jgi:hypothetical protein
MLAKSYLNLLFWQSKQHLLPLFCKADSTKIACLYSLSIASAGSHWEKQVELASKTSGISEGTYLLYCALKYLLRSNVASCCWFCWFYCSKGFVSFKSCFLIGFGYLEKPEFFEILGFDFDWFNLALLRWLLVFGLIQK